MILSLPGWPILTLVVEEMFVSIPHGPRCNHSRAMNRNRKRKISPKSDQSMRKSAIVLTTKSNQAREEIYRKTNQMDALFIGIDHLV